MRLVSLAEGLLLAASAAGGSARGAEPLRHAGALAEKSGGKRRSTDAQIRKALIAESIAGYDRNCPCPYSRGRNGSVCGKRSAYSRPGGEAPLCFAADVSAEMVQAYRDEHPKE
jgi:hypothetical protein